jgi:hypothetical protein
VSLALCRRSPCAPDQEIHVYEGPFVVIFQHQLVQKASIPHLAVHYTPYHNMSPQEAVVIRSKLTAYAAANHGLTAQFTPDEVHFFIDTGASIIITNSKMDFISEIQPIQPTVLKGIASGLSVRGIGDAEYTFRTDDGTYTTVLLQKVL